MSHLFNAPIENRPYLNGYRYDECYNYDKTYSITLDTNDTYL